MFRYEACPAGVVRNSEIYTASAKSILNSVRLRNASGIAYCAFCPASSPPFTAIFSTAASARVKAVDGRKVLHDLHAAAMPVHVAKAADIHQDVEPELLAGRKRTQHLIMLAAMTQSQFDNFPTSRLACPVHR